MNAVFKPDEVLERCAVRIEMGMRMTAEGALMTGQALCEARDALNGNTQAFGKWREERLPWMHRQHALRCMQVWENLGDKLTRLNVASEFSSSVLYALAAPATPETVRTEVLERAQQGEAISLAEVERLKREAKAELQQKEQLAAELSQLQQQHQTLALNLETACERERRTYQAMQETQDQLAALVEEKSREAIEQARQEAQTAQQRVDELREELAHRERQKAYAIREGIQNGLAGRQAEVDALNRAIQQAEAELTHYRQRLKARTGDEHENQRLALDVEKALKETMVLGTTLNMFESEVIYPVNWELLDRMVQCAGAIVPMIVQFKQARRQIEKPVPAE